MQEMQETWVQSLGRGDPLRGGDGNLLQYSCLKTLDGGARSQRVRQDLVTRRQQLCNQKGPDKREVRVREVHVTMEAEVKAMQLLERSHQSSNSGSLYKLEETKDFLIET